MYQVQHLQMICTLHKTLLILSKTTLMTLRDANLGHTDSSEAGLQQLLPAWVQAYGLAMKSFHHA